MNRQPRSDLLRLCGPHPGRRPVLAPSPAPSDPTDPGAWRAQNGGRYSVANGEDPHEPEGLGDGMAEPGSLLDGRGDGQ